MIPINELSRGFRMYQQEYEEKYPIEYGGKIVLNLSDASDVVLKAILGRTSTYYPGLWAKTRGELIALLINNEKLWFYPFRIPILGESIINF